MAPVKLVVSINIALYAFAYYVTRPSIKVDKDAHTKALLLDDFKPLLFVASLGGSLVLGFLQDYRSSTSALNAVNLACTLLYLTASFVPQASVFMLVSLLLTSFQHAVQVGQALVAKVSETKMRLASLCIMFLFYNAGQYVGLRVASEWKTGSANYYYAATAASFAAMLINFVCLDPWADGQGYSGSNSPALPYASIAARHCGPFMLFTLLRFGKATLDHTLEGTPVVLTGDATLDAAAITAGIMVLALVLRSERAVTNAALVTGITAAVLLLPNVSLPEAIRPYIKADCMRKTVAVTSRSLYVLAASQLFALTRRLDLGQLSGSAHVLSAFIYAFAPSVLQFIPQHCHAYTAITFLVIAFLQLNLFLRGWNPIAKQN